MLTSWGKGYPNPSLSINVYLEERIERLLLLSPLQ